MSNGAPPPDQRRGKLRLRSTPRAFWRVPWRTPSGFGGVHQPELHPGGRHALAEAVHDRVPGGLVPVDRADHEDVHVGVRIAHPHDLERSPLDRAAVALGRRRGGERAATSRSAARRTRISPQVVSRICVHAVGCRPDVGPAGLGGPAGLRYRAADAQHGRGRSRDVRGVARLVAGTRRRRGDARRPVRSRRRARHVGRRVAAAPQRSRAGCRSTPRRRAGRARCGASSRPSAARSCSSSAGSCGSPTPRTASRRATMATFDAQGIPYERLDPEAGARLYPSFDPAGLAFLLHEPEAGVLRAQRATQALARRAAAHGATVLRAARGARRRARAARRRPHAGGRRRGLGVRPVARRPVPRGRSRSARPGRSCSSSTAGRPGRADGVPAYVDFDRAIYGTRDLDGLGVKAAPDFDGPPLDPDAALPRRDARGRGARARVPRRALPGARGRAAQRLEVLPLRADARRALRRRAASGAPVRLAARRRLGPRLQARPRDGRAGRRGARGRRAAARDLRARRPRPGRPPAHRWRDGARRRRVGAMHDYLIVGAGSAGCALAARLTEDPDVSVLLVEAGPPDSEEALHIPVAFSKLYRTPFDWDYSSGPEPALDGRELYVPRGPRARRLLVAERDDLHPRQPARLRRVGPRLGLGRRAPLLPPRRGQRARRERAARRGRPAVRERRALEPPARRRLGAGGGRQRPAGQRRLQRRRCRTASATTSSPSATACAARPRSPTCTRRSRGRT